MKCVDCDDFAVKECEDRQFKNIKMERGCLRTNMIIGVGVRIMETTPEWCPKEEK